MLYTETPADIEALLTYLLRCLKLLVQGEGRIRIVAIDRSIRGSPQHELEGGVLVDHVDIGFANRVVYLGGHDDEEDGEESERSEDGIPLCVFDESFFGVDRGRHGKELLVCINHGSNAGTKIRHMGAMAEELVAGVLGYAAIGGPRGQARIPIGAGGGERWAAKCLDRARHIRHGGTT